MIISIDTECTGLDLAHGAMPFLVTTCDDGGVIRFWEWDVDPLTRKPNIPADDVVDIAELLDAADIVYLHNAKFDARALATIGITLPWHKVRDTLVAGHLLASNRRHDLTWMCVEYLGVNIEPLELSIKAATRECRAIARRDHKEWRIAEEGAADLPSVKGGSARDEDRPWKNDMWLPSALANQMWNSGRGLDYAPHGTELDGNPLPLHRWRTACSRYANSDSESTLYLGLEVERLIRERGLWAIYEHRLELPRIAYDMETYGVTTIGGYTEATIREYTQYVSEAAGEMVKIANTYGHKLQLAEGAALNDNMRDFFYGAVVQVCPRCDHVKRIKHWNGERIVDTFCPRCINPSRKRSGMKHTLTTVRRANLGLPVIPNKKTGNASLDKEAMQEYLTTLDGTARGFVALLMDKRRHDTDLAYMQAYRRFWVPVPGAPGYYRIHPSLNPCGTDHLRWASNNPNLQNVAKQEDVCYECEGKGCDACRGTGQTRISVRNCFGPALGREWWSMDFQNIELRIPAYESGEEAMIELFERPNEAPYFGSYHLLNASIVYPELFWPLAQEEGAFKIRYKSTQYQWAKNGGFALQYGCGDQKADRTFRASGAGRMLREKLPKVAALAQKHLLIAERTGFVETLPDRSVDSQRGYPILASRTEDGRVLSTTPFNYHVSGTACWVKNRALQRCAAQLAEWRADGFDAHIALEIHDEILFDFPRGSTPKVNLDRAMVLKRLMEQSGEDLIPRIPSPVSVEYHDVSWAKGRAL